MSENGTVTATDENAENKELNQAEILPEIENVKVEKADEDEEVSYHAVEKEGKVTAIWETQGKKHLRTIDPRSSEGRQILALFETAG